MSSRAIQTAYRPRNIGSNGMIVKLDKCHFDWFDKLLNKYYHPQVISKLIRNFSKLPKIGAIEITEGSDSVALMVLSTKSDPKQIRIDHYTGANTKADFSVSMTRKNDEIRFKELTDISDNNFRQLSNFITGVYLYTYYMHIEKGTELHEIVPIEVFGQPLV